MKDFESLAHVRWECKYHVIFIPKYRRKVIYGKLRAAIGGILRDLCKQKGIGLLEGHAVSDHVHLCLSIPPKYSVSYTIGFFRGRTYVKLGASNKYNKRDVLPDLSNVSSRLAGADNIRLKSLDRNVERGLGI